MALMCFQNQEERQADMYEHVKDSESHYDTQTLDVATAEQQEKQGQISQENEEAESDADSDTKMADDEDDKQVTYGYKTDIHLQLTGLS